MQLWLKGTDDPCKNCVVKHAAAFLKAGCFKGKVGGDGEKQFNKAFCKHQQRPKEY